MSARLNEVFEQVLNALKDARDHLDYCGYGDRWEHECAVAQKLPETIDCAIAAGEEEAGS